MGIINDIWAKLFGAGTDASKTGEKGLRGALTFVASLLIANVDVISGAIMKIVPDAWETVTISGVGAQDITVQAIIVFVLVAIANLLKRSPLTKDNKLIRAISG